VIGETSQREIIRSISGNDFEEDAIRQRERETGTGKIGRDRRDRGE
jgi:hypothetical protein